MKTITIEGSERAAFLATEHPELTFEKAQSLIGRRIRWTHPVYHANYQFVYETSIGSIRNSYEEAAKEPRKGWPSKAAWLDAEQPETAEEMRRTFLVFDDEGVCTYMFCIFPEEGERIAVGGVTCQVVDTDPVFWCSDADRPVTFEVVD